MHGSKKWTFDRHGIGHRRERRRRGWTWTPPADYRRLRNARRRARDRHLLRMERYDDIANHYHRDIRYYWW